MTLQALFFHKKSLINQLCIFILGVCLGLITNAYAASTGGCSNYTPDVNGTVVECQSTTTPAATAGVISTQNSTTVGNNVTVNISSGTLLNFSGSTVGLGSGAVVNNYGSLNTNSFTYGYGISVGANGRSQAGGATINNYGTIITAGASANGIQISATNASSLANSINNSGSIQTSGAGANGIQVTNGGSISSIYNSGTIAASGNNSNGIQITGAANIVNSGIICPSGILGGNCNGSGSGNGIQIDNNANSNRSTITNNSNGLIGAPNSGNYAIYSAQQPGVDIYNYGAISASSVTATAINFAGLVSGGSNNTVTLYGGSTLVGGISFNKGNTQETLTFNGFTNNNFSNPISGLNVINLTNNSKVLMNSSAGYELVSGQINAGANSALEISTAITDQTSPSVIASSLTKLGAGTLTLSGVNTYTGGTQVNQGTLILTGSLASDTLVAASGTLQGGGTINGDLTNAGNITPSISGNITNLTINGNYVGQNGLFNTNVYAPTTSPTADQLIITGTATGSTSIKVIDKGGLGNPTTGNGIQVITGTGTASSSAFALNGRVASGAYEYKLYKGDTSGNGNNWYLRTDVPVAPVIAVTPDARERVEVAVYPAVPTLARTYINTTVDTLDQRRGDLSLLDLNQGSVTTRDWARLIGTNGKLSPDDINNGPKLNINSVALQFGTDLYQNQGSDGSRTYFGPYATIGNSNTSTFNTAGTLQTGSAKLDAYTLGLNATHFIGNGVYFDSLLQGTRFANVTASSTQNADIKTNGWGFAGSLETGIQIPLSQKVSLTPQAQIVFSSNTLSNTTDAYGQINFQQDNSTRARLGLMLSGKETEGNKLGSFWLRTSIWESFNSSTTTSFQSLYGVNAVAFNSVIGGRWISVDGGFTARLSKSSYAFLNASVETSINNPTYQTVSGRFGVQTRW